MGMFTDARVRSLAKASDHPNITPEVEILQGQVAFLIAAYQQCAADRDAAREGQGRSGQTLLGARPN